MPDDYIIFPSIPEKATDDDINDGEDDTKYVTPADLAAAINDIPAAPSASDISYQGSFVPLTDEYQLFGNLDDFSSNANYEYTLRGQAGFIYEGATFVALTTLQIIVEIIVENSEDPEDITTSEENIAAIPVGPVTLRDGLYGVIPFRPIRYQAPQGYYITFNVKAKVWDLPSAGNFTMTAGYLELSRHTYVD